MKDLNKKQKDAVEESGNVLVSASPGSGKTRTLLGRAKYKLEEMPKGKTLALITYTNAAADEISSRLDSKKDFFVGTIHKFCLEYILRPFSWLYDWKQPEIISYEQKNNFINILKKHKEIDLQIRDLNKIKRNFQGKINTSVDWRNEYSLKKIASYYFKYLDHYQLIDFNEILYRSYKIVKENDFVCTSLANKFYEILIDEFQDTSKFQYKIFKMINSKNKCSFFMVGDPKQSIMGFAGTMDKVFNKAKENFNTSIISLIKTYRSTWNIINTYSSIFENHPEVENESKFKDLDYEVKLFNCSSKNKSESCSYCHYNNCKNNIKLISNCIDELKKSGVTEDGIAILSPWWNDCSKINRQLRDKYNLVGLGALPHKNIKSSTFFLIRSVAKFERKKSVNNIRAIKRNIEEHLLKNNIQLQKEKEFRVLVNNLLSDFLNINNKKISIIDGLKDIKSILDSYFEINHYTIDKIINGIKNENAQGWPLVKYLNILAGINGIVNQTLHSAKGLEFDAVILNRIDEGRVPYGGFGDSCVAEKDIKNGKRLFYVGVSRPKKFLRIIHGDNKSRFLEGIT
ncbi:UvrD-helicase domain-containing protein [Halanaerobaculum tunisiense]